MIFSFILKEPALSSFLTPEDCDRGLVHLERAPAGATAFISVDMPADTDNATISIAATREARRLLKRFVELRGRHIPSPEEEAELLVLARAKTRGLTPRLAAAKTEVLAIEPEEECPHHHPHPSDPIRMPLAPDEESETIDIDISRMKEFLPRMRGDLMAIVKRPFEIVLKGDVSTSATDCRRVVEINPKHFLEGDPEVGFGMLYHEGGHLCFSRDSTLMARAQALGGSRLQWIANLIVDRKDDAANAKVNPGFAEVLRARLPHLEAGSTYEGFRDEKGTQRWKRSRPQDDLADFFLACKMHRRARSRLARECVIIAQRAIDRVVEQGASDEEILQASLLILDKLAPAFAKREAAEASGAEGVRAGLNVKVLKLSGCEQGHGHCTPQMIKKWKKLLAGLRKCDREEALRKMPQLFRNMRGSAGGMLSGKTPKVHSVPKAHAEYQVLLALIRNRVQNLIKLLARLGRPENKLVLHGKDEGELDLARTYRIAIGSPRVYCERIPEIETEAEVHLLLDHSGSMEGHPSEVARLIGVLFNEAILSLTPKIIGRIWGFGDEVYDYGQCARGSGIAKAGAKNEGTDEAGALRVVGKELLKSQRKNRILIVVCDGGPANPEAVKEVAHRLGAAGVICIRALVGVTGCPPLYPLELPFSTFDEFLDELPHLIAPLVARV